MPSDEYYPLLPKTFVRPLSQFRRDCRIYYNQLEDNNVGLRFNLTRANPDVKSQQAILLYFELSGIGLLTQFMALVERMRFFLT